MNKRDTNRANLVFRRRSIRQTATSCCKQELFHLRTSFFHWCFPTEYVLLSGDSLKFYSCTYLRIYQKFNQKGYNYWRNLLILKSLDTYRITWLSTLFLPHTKTASLQQFRANIFLSLYRVAFFEKQAAYFTYWSYASHTLKRELYDHELYLQAFIPKAIVCILYFSEGLTVFTVL